jgi:hypothetical protein
MIATGNGMDRIAGSRLQPTTDSNSPFTSSETVDAWWRCRHMKDGGLRSIGMGTSGSRQAFAVSHANEVPGATRGNCPGAAREGDGDHFAIMRLG